MGNKFNKTHGMTGTKVYTAWDSMRQRCYNEKMPSYHRYGGRGISVCPEWRFSFEAFYAYIGDPPGLGRGWQVDRINNDGNYEPGNVRWATPVVQCRNQSRNHIVTHNGKTATLAEICEDVGVKESHIIGRLCLGHSLKHALGMALRKRSSKRYVVWQGERMTEAQLSVKMGFKRDLITIRLKRGWSLEEAVRTGPLEFGRTREEAKATLPRHFGEQES